MLQIRISCRDSYSASLWVILASQRCEYDHLSDHMCSVRQGEESSHDHFGGSTPLSKAVDRGEARQGVPSHRNSANMAVWTESVGGEVGLLLFVAFSGCEYRCRLKGFLASGHHSFNLQTVLQGVQMPEVPSFSAGDWRRVYEDMN